MCSQYQTQRQRRDEYLARKTYNKRAQSLLGLFAELALFCVEMSFLSPGLLNAFDP